MIPAEKNVLVERWFRWYVRGHLRRSFHRVLLTGNLPAAPDGPLIVCMNHSSQWDMLIAYWLSNRLGWDSYGAMDQRQLERYPFLSRAGMFGADRESAQGGREFLQYARGLLEGRRRVLWLPSQAGLAPNDVRPIRVCSGLGHLAQALGTCYVATATIDYEFWDGARPEALVSLGRVQRVEARDAASSKALMRELECAMERQMTYLDTLRRRRDPAQFRTLLQGSSGISPLYDTLRRITSRGRRSPAPLEHGAVGIPPRPEPASEAERPAEATEATPEMDVTEPLEAELEVEIETLPLAGSCSRPAAGGPRRGRPALR
jgi:hypothetical protein